MLLGGYAFLISTGLGTDPFLESLQLISSSSGGRVGALELLAAYQVKMGQVPQFEAAMKRYRDLIVEHAPELEYVVHQTVVGAEAGQYLLAVPMEGMVSMGETTDLDGIIQHAIGAYAWQQLTEDFYSSVASDTSAVVVMRRDLSLNLGE